MKKTVNRTVIVKTGKMLTPDYENRTFEEKQVTFFDDEKVPDNVTIESEEKVKVTMPLEDFFNNGEKKSV